MKMYDILSTKAVRTKVKAANKKKLLQKIRPKNIIKRRAKKELDVLFDYLSNNGIVMQKDILKLVGIAITKSIKVKLEKPPFKPVEPKNTEASSEYAKILDKIKPKKIEPRFVDFKKDVKRKDIGENKHFYYVKNPVNSIFSFCISNY